MSKSKKNRKPAELRVRKPRRISLMAKAKEIIDDQKSISHIYKQGGSTFIRMLSGIDEVFANAETTDYIIGCSETNSRKLIVRNVELMKTFYYAVVVQNSAGSNELCSKVKYTLTD